MLMTSLLAGYLMLRSWTRRAALVMIAVPLLMLKNAIRIDTLSLLSIHVDPGIIEGRLHHEGGIVFFALGLVLLYPVLLALIKSERRLVHSS
jgi:exosortase/archaeosortase family protein